jgi:phenylacetate-coenzyme A ligase PaaK-like adenylate-forming protein
MLTENVFSELQPYSLSALDKAKVFNPELLKLTRYHYNNCQEYRIMLDSCGFDLSRDFSLEEIPFLPVRLFKEHDLISVDKAKIVKTLTSSGTSGQSVSKIHLSKETALNQTKALVKIVSEVLGSRRTPMIILDSSAVLKNRKMFSARGAGILGFSLFGNQKIYAFNDQMELNVGLIRSFVEQHEGEKIFLFGFTYIIFQNFIKKLQLLDAKIDLSNAVLIHGGGWKKLLNEAVSAGEFRKLLENICNLRQIYDYYGMVEQTGSIYLECDFGHLHTSIFSDIIIRDPSDFSVSPVGDRGIIQTLSALPRSYPGHSLLSEDEGVLLGLDDCGCGRLGKYFRVFGRLENAEIRGCSDTYE